MTGRAAAARAGRSMLVETAADACVWGYPLVAVHRARAAHPQGAGGGMVARQRLSTAADRTVVAPNNDTLYASGWFDLGAGDVIVDVDAMDRRDRYWSVMLLDAYTNVSYVCRRLHGTDGATVRVRCDPSRPPAGPAADPPGGVLTMATPTLWALARVLVDGPDDLVRARAALSRIRVHQPRRGPAAPSAAARAAEPAVRSFGPAGAPAAGADGGEHEVRFFDDLRHALALDPPAPWHPPLPPAAANLLAEPPPAGVLADGARLGEARIRAYGRGLDRTGNGWGTRSRGAAFGDDVAYRAAFAKFSLAGHLPAENRSYSRVVDGSRPAMLRFPTGGEPPVDGFWSLSVYGPDMFFVDNPIGRFSVGDRTPGLLRGADGSLTVTIGHDRPRDTANWLPAPAGPCVLVLRAYEGHPRVVDATWFPPDVTDPTGSGVR